MNCCLCYPPNATKCWSECYTDDHPAEILVYVCLFTCAVTRAVHLEIVTDLSTETLLQAFRRFSSHKSLPRTVISDNTSTYLAAADELKKPSTSPLLSEALSKKGVTWQFIPKRAPWYGGFWEHLIGLTKLSLKKMLGHTYTTLPILQIFIVEVETILNDHPLTYLLSDITDPQPLTPSHLIYGRRIVILSHLGCEDDEVRDSDYNDSGSQTRRAKIQALLLKHFWLRWRQGYLTSLREFHKTIGNNIQKVKVGDIVLVHDDDTLE